MDTAGAKAGTLAGENRAEVMRYLEEVWNRHDLGAIDGLVSPDYPNHAASEGHRRDGAEASVGWLLSVFPDNRFDVEGVVAEGETVAVLGTMVGTQSQARTS